MHAQPKLTKKLTLAAVAVLAGLSLTACQDDSTDASSPQGAASSPAAEGSAASSGTTGGTGGSTGGNGGAATDGGGTDGGGTGGDSGSDSGSGSDKGSGGGQVNTGPCKTANLTITAHHGMAEGDVLVSMKNDSDACSLKGFPGVDLNTSDGDTFSADRSANTPQAVVLGGGGTTHFMLHTPPNNTGGTGLRIVSIVVTPPNETHSKTLRIGLSLPVTEAGSDSGPGVTVEPVGYGKQ
ncbi:MULTISPECIES: DUF4232 domain-containing protein [unclassified Streptomyces]|uniref:DUF4232 domain-containing protein n=1 Tax=unclassified Streptomyces TaxID=2593676 RepID=UPI000DAEBAD3|nr:MULTISPECIES: DUF4232 domain-containing protein [unclassified Streptomyces]PZT71944.1 hypothetical protein DNK55_25365 [Streptomyces sp. AC1-42T]PZT81729.1 hypothetical protein DNK56_06195 [Streptomyces sp. AC1-42W]